MESSGHPFSYISSDENSTSSKSSELLLKLSDDRSEDSTLLMSFSKESSSSSVKSLNVRRNQFSSGGIDSGRNGASTDERIADRIVRMDVSRPPFSEWLFNPWEPSLLSQASSSYNSFPLRPVLLSLLFCKLYPAQQETLPQKIHSATNSSWGVCY